MQTAHNFNWVLLVEYVCVCVGAAEGLVAREILTYRSPLPAALSLASTSQRKRSAAARLIYHLSLPLASLSLSFSWHCYVRNSSPIIILFTSPACTHTVAAEQLLSPSICYPLTLISLSLSSSCSLVLFLTSLYPSSSLFSYFTLSP